MRRRLTVLFLSVFSIGSACFLIGLCTNGFDTESVDSGLEERKLVHGLLAKLDSPGTKCRLAAGEFVERVMKRDKSQSGRGMALLLSNELKGVSPLDFDLMTWGRTLENYRTFAESCGHLLVFYGEWDEAIEHVSRSLRYYRQGIHVLCQIQEAYPKRKALFKSLNDDLKRFEELVFNVYLPGLAQKHIPRPKVEYWDKRLKYESVNGVRLP